MVSLPPFPPDLERGLGARVTLPPAGEAGAAAGHGAGRLHQCGGRPPAGAAGGRCLHLGDLLLYSLDDLEEIAAEKGGIRALLDEKWRKVYQANAPRRLFTTSEMRAA